MKRIHLLGTLSFAILVAGCGSDGSSAPGTLQFSSASYSVFENGDSVSITVDRVGGSSGEVTVDYTTRDNGTAVAGADYVTTIGRLDFADGMTREVFTVPVEDDLDIGSNISFGLELSNPTGGATLGSPIEATVTILDDEGIYDFEGLSEGDIGGQDNWVVDPTAADATKVASVITDSTDVNGTKVVRPESQVDGSAGEGKIARVNDASFSFATLTGDVAEIQFDATGDDNALFALGQDVDGDGFLNTTDTDKELGVSFGIFERNFAIFAANSLVEKQVSSGLGDDNDETDWYRLRLQIDFLANGGEGSGSLAYMNLSRDETSFTDVAELQGVNLKLLLNGAPDKAVWDTLFVLLRIDAENIPKADNLVPNATTP